MIEAAMLWNEPNNKSHWDPEVDPEWSTYADCVIRAGNAIRGAQGSTNMANLPAKELESVSTHSR